MATPRSRTAGPEAGSQPVATGGSDKAKSAPKRGAKGPAHAGHAKAAAHHERPAHPPAAPAVVAPPPAAAPARIAAPAAPMAPPRPARPKVEVTQAEPPAASGDAAGITEGLKGIEERLSNQLAQVKERLAAMAKTTPRPEAAPVKEVPPAPTGTPPEILPKIAEGLKGLEERVLGQLTQVKDQLAAQVKAAARHESGSHKPAPIPVAGIAQEIAPRITEGLKGLEERLLTQLTPVKDQLAVLASRAASQERPAERQPPANLDEDIDQVSRAVKRAIVDVFERSSDRLALPLVKVHRYLEEIARRAGNEAPGLREHLSACVADLTTVVQEMGVIQFDAEEGEYFDPMIHQSVGESRRDDMSDGLVLRSVAPGYRSPNERVLLPALVMVNRK